MSQDERADGSTGEYRKEMVKKLVRKKEVDTIDRDTINE
jgi:hypothetical protein